MAYRLPLAQGDPALDRVASVSDRVSQSHMGSAGRGLGQLGDDGREALPVAVMPDPRVASILGPEVRLAVVVDLGGKAQQPPVACPGVGLGGRGREAALLHGALEHEHGPVLQVGGLLHDLRTEDQVGGGCGGWHGAQARRKAPHACPSP